MTLIPFNGPGIAFIRVALLDCMASGIRKAICIVIVATVCGCTSQSELPPLADHVLVEKAKGTLHLQASGKTFASFAVALGGNPTGHKQRAGDERTPEGRYVLDAKNAGSAYHKSIHISYPNASDLTRARAANVNAGGDIMIHGQRNGWGWLWWITQRFNWTDGCIALNNDDMEVVWHAVQPGTPITVLP